MDARELVSRLIDAGLVAKYLGGPAERIMGGTSCEAVPVENDAVIDVYQQAFTIYRVPEGWTVLVSQPQKLDLEALVPDLEQALTIVLEGYGIIKKVNQ